MTRRWIGGEQTVNGRARTLARHRFSRPKRRGRAEPARALAEPARALAEPARALAEPARALAEPARALAEPARAHDHNHATGAGAHHDHNHAIRACVGRRPRSRPGGRSSSLPVLRTGAHGQAPPPRQHRNVDTQLHHSRLVRSLVGRLVCSNGPWHDRIRRGRQDARRQVTNRVAAIHGWRIQNFGLRRRIQLLRR